MSSEKETLEVGHETVVEKTPEEFQKEIKKAELKFKRAMMAVVIMALAGGLVLLNTKTCDKSKLEKANEKLKSKNTKLIERNESLQDGIRLYDNCLGDITGMQTTPTYHVEGEEFVWYRAVGPGILIKMEKGSKKELGRFSNPGQKEIKRFYHIFNLIRRGSW